MDGRVRVMLLAVVALLGVTAWSMATAAVPLTQGPSFSCTDAKTAVERAVCASPSLSAADRAMAELYSMSKVSVFGKGPSSELAAQRAVLRDLARCDNPDSAVALPDCIARVYAHRSNDLAIALAPTIPERALPSIRGNDPLFAPIIEAIALWSSEPRDADWSAPERGAKRARILALLAPATDIMLTDRRDAPWGRDILRDGQDGLAVRLPADLFRSDRHFAFFLNALGPYLPDGMGDRAFPFERNIPCAAIVRHPALLRATTSLFGSTLDNFVFRNDCEATTPPLPRLTALRYALNKGWPNCEGTIRFAAYRAATTAYDEARLGLAPHDKTAWVGQRYGITAATLKAVRGELTAYYIAYFDRSLAAARAMADDSLKNIFMTTHQCS